MKKASLNEVGSPLVLTVGKFTESINKSSQEKIPSTNDIM